MPKVDTEMLLIVFVGIAAVAVLLQSFVLLALYLAVKKATRSLEDQVDEVRSSIMPILDNVRTLVSRSAPKIDAAVCDIAEVAHNLKGQTQNLQETVDEVLARVRQQGGRIDSMLSTVLNTIENTAHTVSNMIGKPVLQFSGIVSSVKAMVDAMRAPTGGGPGPHPQG